MAKALTATQIKKLTAYNTHLEGVVITQSNQIGHMWSFMSKIQTHDETSDHTRHAISQYRTHHTERRPTDDGETPEAGLKL
jgi:hypothetical protein